MAATYKHMREVGQAKELKARLQETYREQNEQLAALIKHGRGSGKHEFETCMHIPVDAATGSSDSSVAEVSVKLPQLYIMFRHNFYVMLYWHPTGAESHVLCMPIWVLH